VAALVLVSAVAVMAVAVMAVAVMAVAVDAAEEDAAAVDVVDAEGSGKSRMGCTIRLHSPNQILCRQTTGSVKLMRDPIAVRAVNPSFHE
jgi:hypothetical protein